MREIKKGWIFLLLCILGGCILASCAPAGGEDLFPEPEEGVLTYAALNPVTGIQKRYINIFNREHADIQIEVLDYTDEGGVDRLLTELALGWVPDIMELHCLGSIGDTRPRYYTGEIVGGKKLSEGEYWMPYRQLARKGYLEDLWPYIENDPKLGRDGVMEGLLEAAEVDGGLYMLFREVYVNTLVGAESVVGDRDGWTLEELMEVFSTMPEDATILRYNATRWEMYSQLFSTTLDRYVDWGTGQCSFDNDEFRDMLEFLSVFPAEFKTALTSSEIEDEIGWRRLEGRQMLETVCVGHLLDVPRMKATFGGGRITFVGYPTADGSSGSFFQIWGTPLAMSSACRNKEAAWEFIGYLIRDAYSTDKMEEQYWDNTILIPINRESYENGKIADLKRRKEWITPLNTFPSGPDYIADPPTEEDLQRYEKLINSTTQIYWPDDALSEIVWEAIGPYFAGDKTLDETIQMVQNRVKLYVNEQK